MENEADFSSIVDADPAGNSSFSMDNNTAFSGRLEDNSIVTCPFSIEANYLTETNFDGYGSMGPEFISEEGLLRDIQDIRIEQETVEFAYNSLSDVTGFQSQPEQSDMEENNQAAVVASPKKSPMKTNRKRKRSKSPAPASHKYSLRSRSPKAVKQKLASTPKAKRARKRSTTPFHPKVTSTSRRKVVKKSPTTTKARKTPRKSAAKKKVMPGARKLKFSDKKPSQTPKKKPAAVKRPRTSMPAKSGRMNLHVPTKQAFLEPTIQSLLGPTVERLIPAIKALEDFLKY